MIERVTYTTQPSAQSMGRYITVYAPDGSYVSRHINMEECTESALSHAQSHQQGGTYRFVPPEKHMSVQIIKTVPGVYTGSFIASVTAGRVNAIGSAGTVQALNPSSEPYDLSGFSIPFAYSWPTAPTTTSTVNVTTANQSVLASPTSGTLYNVAAGTYTVSPNFNNHTDIDVVCDNAAFFSNQVTIGSRVFTNVARIRWTGGNWRDRCIVERATDVLFNNINSEVDAGGAGDYFNQFGGESNTDPRLQRFAVINCTFRMVNANSSGGWAIAMLPSPTVFSDIIIANCVLESVAQTNRFQGLNEFIIVDSYFNMELNDVNGCRIQYECNNVFMQDCHVAQSFQMNNSDGTYACQNGTFNNVTRYAKSTDNTAAFASTGGTSTVPNSGTITGCQMYAETNVGNSLSVGDFTDGGNPVIAAWDGVTTPSTAAAGADH